MLIVQERFTATEKLNNFPALTLPVRALLPLLDELQTSLQPGFQVCHNPWEQDRRNQAQPQQGRFRLDTRKNSSAAVISIWEKEFFFWEFASPLNFLYGTNSIVKIRGNILGEKKKISHNSTLWIWFLFLSVFFFLSQMWVLNSWTQDEESDASPTESLWHPSSFHLSGPCWGC